MKRQIALVLVGLFIGSVLFAVPVASGHIAANPKCAFDVEGVYGKVKDGQTVKLWVWVKNTSHHTMRNPVMFLSIQSNASGPKYESVSLGHSIYRPDALKPGEVSKDRYKVKADPGEVGHVWLKHCHSN